MTELVFPRQKKLRRIPTFVEVVCPGCSKRRLFKEQHVDGKVDEVSKETYKAPDGSDRPVDVCGYCFTKFERRDKVFLRREIIKLQKAAAEAQKAENNNENANIEL